MSVQVEKLEKNMAKLTVEVPAEEFIAALDKAYQAEKNKINVPGFRKGKAPRKMIQKLYGAGVFFEDAANRVINASYPKAADECGETIVSRPSIAVEQIEEGKPFIFTAEVALKPAVTLGEYKGLEVEVTPVEVSDEEVDAEIEKEREQNSREIDVDDRPVENGDIIKLDFEGSIDGVPFDGGKGTDYPLTIGSGSFIPGFEEQLIGTSIGEEKDVTVTFPENYQAEELQGKEAVFKCTVNAITVKELPELDDEFAQDVSEFDTFEEYKNDIRAKQLEKKQEEARRAKQNKAVAKAAENAQMDIPEPMIDEQIERMTENMSNQLRQQGITLEQYMQFMGMTPDAMKTQLRPDAVKRIQNSLVLEAVAEAENIEISDERLDEEIKKMAESYRMEFDKLKELIGESETEQMKSDLAIQAAADLITDSAVEVETVETPDEASAETSDETDEIEEVSAVAPEAE
ncbi:MAG: trigger factor [Lachnospiraceae bacterium]|nr:trigger factor [Lachnospiraceae bacterium]